MCCYRTPMDYSCGGCFRPIAEEELPSDNWRSVIIAEVPDFDSQTWQCRCGSRRILVDKPDPDAALVEDLYFLWINSITPDIGIELSLQPGGGSKICFDTGRGLWHQPGRLRIDWQKIAAKIDGEQS